MKDNGKIKYVPAELTVVLLSSDADDIITTSGGESNGFDGETDNW